MLRPNTAIEDVAAVIGFNATACLIQWHGGRNIYIPDKPTPSHPLAGLLGLVALATHLGLADGFAGGGNAGLDGWRSICAAFGAGISPRCFARVIADGSHPASAAASRMVKPAAW